MVPKGNAPQVLQLLPPMGQPRTQPKGTRSKSKFGVTERAIVPTSRSEHVIYCSSVKGLSVGRGSSLGTGQISKVEISRAETEGVAGQGDRALSPVTRGCSTVCGCPQASPPHTKRGSRHGGGTRCHVTTTVAMRGGPTGQTSKQYITRQPLTPGYACEGY